MLKLIRNKKELTKQIIWGIAILIIFSMGIMGTAYLLNSGDSRQNSMGKIFGHTISRTNFGAAYKQVEIQAIMRYGENYNNIRRFLNLESDTWDRLIVLDEIKKRRIAIADSEVVKAIESYEFFKRDGQFDSLLYNDILKYVFNIQPRDFEEGVRQNLSIAKLYEQVTSTLTLTDQEIFNEYKRRNEQIQVSYVAFTPEQFKDSATFEENQLLEYYNNNQPEFGVPPSVNLEYVSLKFPTIEPPSEATPETESTEKSEKQEQEKQVLRDKASQIYQDMLQTPEKINDIATKHNVEIKTTGFFNFNEPNPSIGLPFELLTKIYNLREGDINTPFESADGLYIVKLKEKKEAYIPEFETVKEKVKESVLRQAAMKIAQQNASEYLIKIKEETSKTKIDNFSDVAKSLGLTLEQTPSFNRGQYLPKIGISREFQDAAFQLTDQNKISDVVDTTTGYYIVHLDNYISVNQEDFLKEKDKIAEELGMEKKNETFSEFITNLRLRANVINFSKAGTESQN